MKSFKIHSKIHGICEILVDDDDYDNIIKYKWQVNTRGYITRTKRFGVRKENKKESFSLHRVIMNAKKGQCVDHINGNKLDNRKENLRFCTQAENVFNSLIPKNNKSGYKGVRWHKLNKKWTVQIGINNKQLYIGSFTSLEEAALAYDNAAKLYHGKFAKLNFKV